MLHEEIEVVIPKAPLSRPHHTIRRPTHAVMKGGYLHHHFIDACAKYPQRIAVKCGQKTFTFAELDEQSNRLAHALQARGCRPGSMVALYLRRTEQPYVAMLAVLKAGGAYIPLDPAFPSDRIDYILTDAGADIVITEDELAKSLNLRAPHVIKLDRDKDALAALSNLPPTRYNLQPSDPCYAIYTSGSTGQPKGVLLEHRAVANYVSSMLLTYQIQADDIIYQGFSHCFDASIEEIWAAFGSGAQMVVGEDEVCKSAEAVADLINDSGITVFSTVPTFLNAIERDLPSVRLLVVGGERCSQELVNRWAVPERVMLNTYGPTEATVVATSFVCQAGVPVTIGRPLPGYKTYILNAQLETVAHGNEGELCISGPILARGYINLPEQTDKVFAANPYSTCADDARLYRTGDLVRENSEGNIEFIGRIDSQVKIRGYRVELSEIQAVIEADTAIQTAAVKVVEQEGVQHIAVFAVLSSEASFDAAKLRQSIADRLPKYMMPTFFDCLDAMPVLPSGKTNLKALPAPQQRFSNTQRDIVLPETHHEEMLCQLCRNLFNADSVSVDDDFFDDLGGHSLLAAKYAGSIRYELGYECMSIRDVFAHPTVRELAHELSSREHSPSASSLHEGPCAAEKNYLSLSWLTKLMVPSAQVLGIYAIYTFFSAIFALVFNYVQHYIYGESTFSTLAIIVSSLLIFSYPVMLGLSIAAKWLLIGRYKEGHYPVWGSYYLRWWLVTRLQQLSGSHMLCGSPMMTWYYKLMGADIGKRVYLDTSVTMAFDLISIGDDTSIGADTHILGYRIEDGLLKIAPTRIGNHCFIGIHSNIGLNTSIADHCRIEDFTHIADGSQLKSGTAMAGSPAMPAEVVLPKEALGELTDAQADKLTNAQASTLNPSSGKSIVQSLIALYAFFIINATFSLIVIVCAVWVFMNYGLAGTLISLVTGAPMGLISYSLLIVAIKKIVIPKTKAGIYPVAGGFYYRKWFLDLFIKTHRSLFIPLYATLYLPTFLRLLGAKLGKGVEVSTVANISPELIEAGDNSFYADAAIIGGKRVHGGYFQIDICKIGSRTFIGNSAMLPIGSNIGDECLIGCLSTPPADHHIHKKPIAENEQKWLGSPPIKLKNTQSFGGFDDKYLYSPTRGLYIQRYIVDTLRILLPTYLLSAAYVASCFVIWGLSELYTGAAFYALLPAALFGLVLITMGAVIVLKAIIVGVFKPIVKPLWSPYVWFNEVVNSLYEAVYTPCVSLFCGTPFIRYFMRAIGVKMGKRAYVDSLLFSEFDLADIGDYAALNVGCTVQTHLFEDRIMKSSYLKIGRGVTIGNMSVVLYDTHIQEGAIVEAFSLVMKGETLPPHTRWQGIPVHKIG
ncbi:MAG: Pls/PosA family non-ribosomal peptide synthetase [Marinagarivorans sp.]|nr:Pls/PosA family non-ribosomal peptide synthetase [Marinagarivorans sp.]